MKNIKRIIALLLTFLFAFTGCKSNNGKEVTQERMMSQVMYALILSDSGINDNGINQYTWQGILDLKTAGNIQTKYFEAENEDEIKLNIEKAVASDYDVIFSLGDLANANLQKYKSSDPNQLFAFINMDSKNQLDTNSFAVEFADYEGAFLAGYLACETTKTSKIAFLADVDNTSSQDSKYGFYAGAHYYNVLNNKNVQVFDKVIGSKSDSALVKSNLASLYDSGCDIVFVNFDFAQQEMIDTANEKNGKIIGTGYVDDTEKQENLIAKSIKYIGKGIKNISDLYIKNEDLRGKTFVYGLKEGCIAFECDKSQIPLEVIDKIDAVKQKIINGEIDVPAGYEEYQKYMAGSKASSSEITAE